MPVPGFQSFLLPVLEVASDGQEHSVAEAVEAVAMKLGLTPEDRRELLPSGSQRRVDNRVNWACSYLRQAQLLESTGRGKFKITPRGEQVLGKGVSRIDIHFLDQFEEFAEFRSRSRSRGQENGEQPATDQVQTPEEVLESSFQHLRRQLANDLLDRIKRSSPAFFERLVVDLLVAMGYGGSRQDAGQAVGQSGDGGIDGIIKEDKLGLDAVYIQAKRWESTVGRPVVQAFAGSLEGQRARKGVLITTSAFSQDARDYVTRIEKKIVLIDGDLLTELMIDHGVGVAEVASYSVRKVDQDYFEDEK
jgi:restriction system protein